jgi:hypothetical protein
VDEEGGLGVEEGGKEKGEAEVGRLGGLKTGRPSFIKREEFEVLFFTILILFFILSSSFASDCIGFCLTILSSNTFGSEWKDNKGDAFINTFLS